MSEFKQVGTVEILVLRVYVLDADSTEPCRTGVVEPGIYPLYSDGLAHFWVMQGKLNAGALQRKGDGMFFISAYDILTDISVTFPSHTYGPDEFEEFCNHSVAREGHPSQRLRITLND